MAPRRPSDLSADAPPPAADDDAGRTAAMVRRGRSSAAFSADGPASVDDGDVVDAPTEARSGGTQDTGRRRTLDISVPGPLPSGDDSPDDDHDRRHGPDDGPLPAGERSFGPYTLLRRLAFGGMGEVFLARHDTTLSASLGRGPSRLVVVKRILAHMRRDEKQRRAFVDEARLQMLLRSNHIVQVHDVGEVDGQVYLAMEHVHGPSLRAVIDRCRRARQHLPLAYIVDVMVQAAEALSYAHNLVDATSGQPLRVVHRDINPHNVLVTYDGEVKLIDFGIAKSDLREQQTETGTIKGKFAYMSPEQSAAEPLDARSDLFALGICFYELVTLTNPFKRGNVVLSLEAIQRTTPALPSTTRPGAAILDPIIERMLRKNPDDRFADCSEVAEALRLLQHDGLVPEPRQPFPAWLRSLFADDIQDHQQVLDRTGSHVDAVVSSPRLARAGSTGSFTASRPGSRSPSAPPTEPLASTPEDPPPASAPEDAAPASSASPAADRDGAGGTGPTGALVVRRSRSAPLIAAVVTLGVAGAFVGGWAAWRTTARSGGAEGTGAVAVADAGLATPSSPVDAGGTPGDAGVAPADAGSAAGSPAVDAGLGTAEAGAAVVDGGAARTTEPAPPPSPPPKEPAPKEPTTKEPRDAPKKPPPPGGDVVGRVVVTNSEGFVVKGPRTISEKQPATLVVDDRDAPLKLRLRVRVAEDGGLRLTADSEPWSILRVDQVGRGRTPVADVPLVSGRRTSLSFQNPQGAAMELTLTATGVPRSTP